MKIVGNAEDLNFLGYIRQKEEYGLSKFPRYCPITKLNEVPIIINNRFID